MTIWYEQLKRDRAIAVIRTSSVELGFQMAQAVAAGGLRQIEVSWKSHRADVLIQRLRSSLRDCTIGAGTLFDIQQLQEAIEAGAQFLFSPHTHPPLIQAALNAQVPIVPGTLSPTEIITAWQGGATAVKVFPISAVGGVNYIQSLQGPLGHIPLIPTGGVTLQNAKAFLDAGAIAVGLGSSLFPPSRVAAGDWQGITAIAQQLRSNLQAL